jgi:hypothetical protein
MLAARDSENLRLNSVIKDNLVHLIKTLRKVVILARKLKHQEKRQTTAYSVCLVHLIDCYESNITTAKLPLFQESWQVLWTIYMN